MLEGGDGELGREVAHTLGGDLKIGRNVGGFAQAALNGVEAVSFQGAGHVRAKLQAYV